MIYEFSKNPFLNGVQRKTTSKADNLYRNLMTLNSVNLDSLDCFEPCSLRKKDQGFICKICVKCDLIYTLKYDFFKWEVCSSCYLKLCMANKKEMKIITMIEQMLQTFCLFHTTTNLLSTKIFICLNIST